MENLNTKHFIAEAKRRLEGKDTHRMAAFHTGITVAAALVVTLLQYVLSLGIESTSGLSGMGTQSILQTMQTVLQWANMVLAPFWNLGFIYVAMLWARDMYARKEDLLTGFHRIGPCLGLLLNRFVISFSVMFLCVNVCSFAYMLTPAAEELMEMAAAAGNDVEVFYELLEQMDTATLAEAMAPLVILWGVLSLAILTPLLYRFRLAEYAILNQKGVRALPAMIISAHLMRHRRWQVFKLDLRLWWYYALKVLCMLLCYLDMLLAAAGISLPVNGDGIYFATYILYLVALLAVETAFRPRVETAYAGVYEAFMAMGPAQKKQVPVKPQNVPWDEQ